jgi:hypothetical protein
MDTLSHGLWATAVGKGVNRRSTKKIKIGLMALWGIIPDLFAFTPVVIWMLWQLLYKGVSFSDIPRPEIMSPEERNAIFILRLSETLYHISHSVIVFLVLFFLVWGFRYYRLNQKRKTERTFRNTLHQEPYGYTPCWEMTGWFIHVLMDIPTHSGMLYPTLFLWPLSDWYYDGNSWGTLWFMIANYSCLLIVFILLRFVRKVKDT